MCVSLSFWSHGSSGGWSADASRENSYVYKKIYFFGGANNREHPSGWCFIIYICLHSTSTLLSRQNPPVCCGGKLVGSPLSWTVYIDDLPPKISVILAFSTLNIAFCCRPMVQCLPGYIFSILFQIQIKAKVLLNCKNVCRFTVWKVLKGAGIQVAHFLLTHIFHLGFIKYYLILSQTK